MKKNKVIDWIKRHKGIIIGSLVGIGISSYGIYCYKNYYNEQLSIEGSDIWFRNASLDDLKNYREVVHNKALCTGYTEGADRLLRYIDRKIYYLTPDCGGLNIPPREHGWYLPEKD